jgi:hypothetical protein
MTHMPPLLRCLAPIVLLIAMMPGVHGAEILISNKDCGFDRLDKDSVKNLFLGKKRSLPSGEKAEIIIRSDGLTHEAFLHDMLDETPSQFQTYWKRMVFTGQGRTPTTVNSDADVIDAVSKTKSALGYIDSATPHDGVKVITVGE